MGIFRRRYTNKAGKNVELQKWSLDFRDHSGIVRRVAAFTDRGASVELERQLKKLVSLRMAGAGPDAELSRFLECCPEDLRDHLADWGIIAGERAAAGKAIAKHVADWRQSMEAKGNSNDHIKGFVANLNRVITDCKWRSLSDMSASNLNGWLNMQKSTKRAAATINHHLRAAKAFCNWLVKERRISENPLAHVPLLNANADRRLERRALTVDEIGKLLAAAEAGQIVQGMTGPDRALLYRFALETGFRWSECCSLTRASFNFADDPATVTIRAEDAKNRKDDALPLRTQLAADLKDRMALFLPDTKAFPGMWLEKGANMLRVDLKAAGIAYHDEYGRQADFHALRHTYGTMLNQAGVPLATAQRLMRHSDPKLTANIYTHIMVETKAEALAKLPTLQAVSEGAEMLKTGTDDCSGTGENVIVMKNHDNGENGVDANEAHGRIIVMPIGSKSTDSMDNIRTYTDFEKLQIPAVAKTLENKNALSPKGKQGDLVWRSRRDSNPQPPDRQSGSRKSQCQQFKRVA